MQTSAENQPNDRPAGKPARTHTHTYGCRPLETLGRALGSDHNPAAPEKGRTDCSSSSRGGWVVVAKGTEGCTVGEADCSATLRLIYANCISRAHASSRRPGVCCTHCSNKLTKNRFSPTYRTKSLGAQPPFPPPLHNYPTCTHLHR